VYEYWKYVENRILVTFDDDVMVTSLIGDDAP
jgi:hypothetical protein